MTTPSRHAQQPAASAIIPALAATGVSTVFCGPRSALPTPESGWKGVRQVRCVHAQGAGHAAQGYAVVTGGPGVYVVASPSEFAAAITPLMDAHLDSVPLVLLVLDTDDVDRAGFDEMDVFSVTLAICKHSAVVDEHTDVFRAVYDAVTTARSGRPGPVVLHLTHEALARDLPQPVAAHPLPGGTTTAPPSDYAPSPGIADAPDPRAVIEAARLLRAAERPVIYAGGGVVRADAAEVLTDLCDAEQIPAVTTLMARGCVPDSHPLALGMPGMHGTVAAVGALQRSDLILAVGARFDDRVTGDLESFAPDARVVHLDVDPAEISKNRHADVALVSDARLGVKALMAALSDDPAPRPAARTDWLALLRRWRLDYSTRAGHDDARLAPQAVITRISDAAGPEAVYTAGVGQHQMWAAHFIRFERPRQWLCSGGAGTMGYAVPAALGALVAAPRRVVWAIDGDGCFQMTNRELLTCVREGLPIKVAVINNSSLGMIRQWQTLAYDERYSHSDLRSGVTATRPVPDIAALAEALGCVGLRCDHPDELDATITSAMAVNDRPVVVDFRVAPDEMVWPMIQAGASNDSIQIARDLAPVWDAETL